MSPPRVSVLITSYNQEAYLREAVESVLGQTARPHEIIIADDHTTQDDSIDLIRWYETLHPGLIRGVFHPENVGIPMNRNGGLARVTGDYLVVLDGDDRLLPDYVQKSIDALQSQPGEACVYSNYFHLTSGGERIGERFRQLQPSGDLVPHIACGQRGILRTLLAPVRWVRAAGGFNRNFFYHDGYILSLQLAKVVPYVYLPECLMEKRGHPGGVSQALSRADRVECFEKILAQVARECAHLSETTQSKISQAWLQRIARLRAETGSD